MTWTKKLQEFQKMKVSEILAGRSQDVLTWVHGAIYGRSALSVDPSTLVTTDALRLQARFQNKPGYALFEDKLYLVQFGFSQPIVTLLTLNDTVTEEDFAAMKASFPPENEALARFSETELITFQERLEPLPDILTESFSFNTELLSPYFRDMNPNGLPFIEFSDMGLFSVPEKTKVEELPSIIQKVINKDAPYHTLSDNFLDLPLIIAAGNRYYLYGNTQGNEWALTELDAALLRDRHLPFTPTPCRIEYHPQHFAIYQHIFEKRAHTHFSSQPQQVSQLKKLINSAHYFKLMLQDVEALNLNVSGLFSIWRHITDYVTGATYDKIYRALSLATDIDIDFAQRFHEEVSEFGVLLDRFKYYSKMGKAALPASEQAVLPFLAPGKYQPSSSFQAGNAVGFMTRYIYDPNGQWDIDVLSQFSVDLPKHIDLMTTWINGNTSNVTQYAPNIAPSQLRALQKEATKLLKTLKSTQKNAERSKRNPLNPLYQVYQIYNYALLIGQIISILTTTLAQIGQLNEAYQELLRTYLKILKSAILLLVKHADRIEIEFTLTPGALSRPLLRKLTEYYHFITDHVKGLAEFSFRGEELLVLEDSYFLAEREANIQAIRQESQTSQQEITWAQESAQNFFAHVSTADRSTLTEDYARLAPYIQQTNPALNQQIIAILNNAHGDITYLIPKLQNGRGQIFTYLEKLQQTEALRQAQITAVLAAIPKYSNLQLFPYNKRMGCDIELKIIHNMPLKQSHLKLSTQHPSLLQYRQRGQISYIFYGNTDGTLWDFSTPIEQQFLDNGILQHFVRLEKKMSAPDYHPSTVYKLPYRSQYHSLYQQMLIKKAHTHYYSQFSSLESEVLSEEQETLTHLVFKPLDWIESKIRTQLPALEDASAPNSQPSQSRPTTITTITPSIDRVTNLEELSAEQALKICFWYQKKITAYHDARTHLLDFQRLINQNFTPQSLIQFRTRSTLQKQCHYLYHTLQPYLIGIRNFPHFDQKMVRALSISAADAHTPTAGLTCNELNHILNQFSLFNQAENLVSSWETRAALLLCHAQTAYQNEQARALTGRRTSITIDPRANFLLKTTEISTKIREFRESVGLWALVLNRKIQNQLDINFILAKLNEEELTQLQNLLGGTFANIAEATIHHYRHLTFSVTEFEAIKQILGSTPENIKLSHKFVLKPVLYEEISDLKTQLKQPPFVLLIKRVFNALYHLQYLAEGLEEIPAGNSPAVKNSTIDLVIRLAQAHGPDLTDLILQLRDDPIVAEVGSDLYQQYEYIIQQVCDLIQPHTTPITQVHPREETATFSGLWYSMNSFYMLPHHLLTLTQQRDSNFGYGITLITSPHATLMIPAHQQLSLILHNQQYHLYCNGTGQDWALRRLPTELIAPLNLDFSQEHLNYDHRYQALYDYLIQENYHFTPMNGLQISAKRATKNIEHIIQNAMEKRYFRLFLSLPMVYRLNQELEAQTQTFTRTTQEVVLSHLEILQTDYFARLLTLADDKEHAWGLIHGQLTEPLQAVIDELNQGLVFQLKFDHFRDREDLIVSNELLLKRILAEEKRFAKLSTPNVEQETIYHTLLDFTQAMTTFNASLSRFENSWIGGLAPVPPLLSTQYRTRILLELNIYRHSFVPTWIADIPTTLNAAHLRDIKKQVSAYHKHLSASSLLHNEAQRTLCQTLQTFLANLNQISLPTVPAALENQYLQEIMPALEQQRTSYIPNWLATIEPVLNRDSMPEIINQSSAYLAHLSGLLSNRLLYQDLSREKLLYLWKKLGVEPVFITQEPPQFSVLIDAHTGEELPLRLSNIETFRPNLVNCQLAIEQKRVIDRQQYRLSFAKHYFYTTLNRLPYQASGLTNNKIHKEYHRELRLYLIQHEADIRHNAESQDAVDTYLNPKIQAKIAAFKLQYFERYQRLDRVETALNEFRAYLNHDLRVPTDLRNKKLLCLKAIDEMAQQHERGDLDLESFLNQRSQLLCDVIRTSEETLLEHYPQFNNILDWLIDCLISLFTAIGLYTPERQRRYANLVAANQPQQNLPTGWLQFLTFRSTPTAPSTPPRGPAEAQILTPGTGGRR